MLFDFANLALKFSRHFGLHLPCSLFFGELDFPQEESKDK